MKRLGIFRSFVHHADLAGGALDGCILADGTGLLGGHGHKLAMLEVVVELLSLHSLVLEQVLGDVHQLLGMLGQDLLAEGGSLVKDLLDLGVDEVCSLLGIALGGAEITADKDGVAGRIIADGAQLLAHTIAHDHVTGDGAGVLDVTGGAGGDIVKEQLLGDSAAQSHNDALEHLGAAAEVLQIFLRTEEGEAAGVAAGDDGDIVDRVNILEEAAGNSVAGLVISGELAGLLAHLAALLLGAHLDLEYGLVHILHVDEAVLAAHGQESCLVHQVFKVSTGKTGGALGDGVKVHILSQLLVAGVDLQNSLTAADIGQTNVNLTVKAAGTQQCIVQNVGTVGGSHDDDALVGAKAVHLNQQLVESLLTLIVAAAKAGASLTTDSVDLVDKDDGGGGLLGLLKQVADTAGANTYIKLNKVRAGDGQKLHTGLACHGLGQQGLTGTRRANQQHALGDAGAHGGVGLGVFQKVNDLAELLLLLVAAGNIGEGLLVLLIAAQLGAGLGELGHTTGTAAGLAHHDVPQQHCAAHHQNIGDHAGPPGGDPAFGVVVVLKHAVLALLVDQAGQILVEHGEGVKLIAHILRQGIGIAAILGADLQQDGVALGGEGLDAFIFKQLHKICIALDLGGRLTLVHGEDHRDHDHDEQHIEAQISCTFGVRGFSRFQFLVTSLY